jgi:hypothetical protein
MAVLIDNDPEILRAFAGAIPPGSLFSRERAFARALKAYRKSHRAEAWTPEREAAWAIHERASRATSTASYMKGRHGSGFTNTGLPAALKAMERGSAGLALRGLITDADFNRLTHVLLTVGGYEHHS